MNPSASKHPEGLAKIASGRRAYRAGIAVAITSSFLIVWTTVVRDDGTGMSFFMIVMAAIVGSFATRLQPAGMARTMLGVAIMQLLNGVAIATAPVTANSPDGPIRALAFAAFFMALWLLSANFFRVAAIRNKDARTE